jgi:chromosome segregation ATPase
METIIKKTETLTSKATPENKSKYIREAKKLGMSLSEYIDYCLQKCHNETIQDEELQERYDRIAKELSKTKNALANEQLSNTHSKNSCENYKTQLNRVNDLNDQLADTINRKDLVIDELTKENKELKSKLKKVYENIDKRAEENDSSMFMFVNCETKADILKLKE